MLKMKERFLIISDIHSNWEAASSVFSKVSRKTFLRTIVLGDLVGYGADPNKVINKIKPLKGLILVRGNHDKAAAGLTDASDFNAAAKESARWTLSKLSLQNRNFLKNLPKGPVIVQEGVMACHGSPIDEDSYIFSEYDALLAFQSFDFKICFFGHSHYPCIFSMIENSIFVKLLRGSEITVDLEKNGRHLINPGSVGQPRDRNSMASFGVFDNKSYRFTLYRVPYNIRVTSDKIIRAKLPPSLANRLTMGT